MCVHARVHTGTHTHARTHGHACVHACVYIYMHTCIHRDVHIPLCTQACAHPSMHTCMSIHVYMCAHMHVHTCVHTGTQTYMYTFTCTHTCQSRKQSLGHCSPASRGWCVAETGILCFLPPPPPRPRAMVPTYLDQSGLSQEKGVTFSFQSTWSLCGLASTGHGISWERAERCPEGPLPATLSLASVTGRHPVTSLAGGQPTAVTT